MHEFAVCQDMLQQIEAIAAEEQAEGQGNQHGQCESPGIAARHQAVAFGDHAKQLKINAPKSMLGHTC